MKNLWNDLSKRVREADLPLRQEMPFGFSDAVLQRLKAAGREGSNRLDDWVAVLRPALGLAFGAALVCLLLQFQVEREQPNDSLAQTEALIQYTLFPKRYNNDQD